MHLFIEAYSDPARRIKSKMWSKCVREGRSLASEVSYGLDSKTRLGIVNMCGKETNFGFSLIAAGLKRTQSLAFA